MKNKVSAWKIMLALMLLSGLALGQPGRSGLDPNGRPPLKAGDYLGYLVWRDDNGWHVRWATVKVVRSFSGSITAIGGTFVDAKGANLETKTTDRISITPGLIKFATKTAQQQDGVDFKLSPETKKVRFDLLIDGQQELERVFVGKGKQHPKSMPFEIKP